MLQVISADFVSIVPYSTHSVNVAIGQRHNIIVEADQHDKSVTDYWIRTWSTSCPDMVPGLLTGYEQTGIVRYNRASTDNPNTTAWPDAEAKAFDCADETGFVPIVPWCIGPAANSNDTGEEFNIANGNWTGYALADFGLQRLWPNALSPYNFQIDYSDPTLVNLEKNVWPNQTVVIPENYTENDWVSLSLLSASGVFKE